MVLIAALAVLLMLTILSIGMFRSFGLEERITGNSREKQHAFYAAQSALQYAEAWLSSNGSGGGAACSGTSAAPTICSTPPTDAFHFATTDWHASYGSTYAPVQLSTTQPTGSTAPSAEFVSALPQFTIAYLGADPSGGGGSLYQVTAIGFGGNSNAAAVVQSVYTVTATTTCVSKPC